MKPVTIPKKHYVGMVVRDQSKIPLGFITPWGDDAAAAKRMNTVDNWANTGKAGSLPTTVIENIPMLGFKMSGDIRRGMRGSQDKWRIEDPRGFELEISSENLSMLLADTTLEKGEILDECIWARDGGQNLLLTTVSQEYLDAIKMTEIANNSASWTDAKLGYTVTLQNGLRGQYLGRMHTVQEHSRGYDEEDGCMLGVSNKTFTFILCPTTNRLYPAGVSRELHLISNPKLSMIETGPELTVAEAENLANEALQDPKCFIEKNTFDSIFLAAANKIKNHSWKLSLEDVDCSVDPWTLRYDHRHTVLGRSNDGFFGRCYKSGDRYLMEGIKEDLLSQGIYNRVVVQDQHPSRGAFDYLRTRRSERPWRSQTRAVDPASVINYYHLRIELKTAAGNTLERRI